MMRLNPTMKNCQDRFPGGFRISGGGGNPPPPGYMPRINTVHASSRVIDLLDCVLTLLLLNLETFFFSL